MHKYAKSTVNDPEGANGSHGVNELKPHASANIGGVNLFYEEFTTKAQIGAFPGTRRVVYFPELLHVDMYWLQGIQNWPEESLLDPRFRCGFEAAPATVAAITAHSHLLEHGLASFLPVTIPSGVLKIAVDYMSVTVETRMFKSTHWRGYTVRGSRPVALTDVTGLDEQQIGKVLEGCIGSWQPAWFELQRAKIENKFALLK